MKPLKRITAATLILAATVGGAAGPALASTSKSSHWSSSQCSKYAAKYTHGSKSQKTAANKSLKAHKCKVTVK